MNRLLAFLAAMLVVWPAMAQTQSTGIGRTIGKKSAAGYVVSLTSTTAAGTYVIGEAFPKSVVGFERGSAFVGTLYACETPTYSAATCTAFLSTLNSDLQNLGFDTTRGWYVLTVSTPESSSNTSYLRIFGGYEIGGGGGGDQDADNDGQYEYSYLWDADGDGSTWETCTAKDVPDPACKVAGERIYRDLADDVNCAVHGGCGSGYTMELNGTLYLEPGVYVNWPCWDAREPSGFNDPTATNDNLHDNVADTAWSHCPATPDPDTTRRFYTINLMDWQGEIIGSGTDTRNPNTTASYSRTQGTYIVDDRGPDWEVGTNAGNNNWFGQTSFIRGLTFGFQSAHTVSTSAGVSTGESAGDGDSKGYGTVSGTQTLSNLEDNQYLCVANTSGLNTLVAGDTLLVAGQSGVLGGGSQTVVFATRIRDTPSGTCNASAGIQIPIGGFFGYLGNNASYAAGSIPYAFTFLNGNYVTAARSDYMDSTARIANLNIEPQDWWAEPSGDCSEQMDFADATERAWTADLDGDATNADFDCDTNPLIGLYGAGAPIVENVVVRSWHQYAIDGDSNAGYPMIRRTRFLYGRGGPIVDAGSGWRMHDIEIRDTTFATQGFSTYGPGLEGRDIRAINSSGESLINFTDVSVGNLFENIKLEGGSILHALKFTCGARRNTIRNLTLEGTLGIGSGVLLSRNGIVAWMDCSDVNNPIEQNVIDGFDATGVRMARQLSGNATAGIALNTSPTIASPKSTAIVRNHFSHGRMKSTNASYGACLFAAIDTDTTAAPNDRTGLTPDDYSHEDVLSYNSFFMNSVDTTSAASHVYCGCNINTAGTPDGYGTCAATVGSGSGIGADARGCGNFDGTAVPSPGQSCS